MKNESIKEFYDKLAENYEELYGLEQKEKWDFILNYIKKLDLKTLKIMDLGCGIGIVNCKALFKFSIGVDLSFKSLIKAKNKYNILINADIDNFCFKDSNYLIISVSSLQNLKEKTIKKILSKKNKQIHSVMFKSKGEDYWKELFREKGFKFIKKINNDLIFSNF